MGAKSFVPGTAAYSEKHFVKYLRKKARGHDVLLLIEWADGQLTEMPADYHADKDGWYKTPPGLMFANVGEGVDPVSFHGVPTVRCHAEIACPISTTAAIQAEYEEAGEFDIVSDNGKTQKVVQFTPADENGNGHSNGEAVADGGGYNRREYDIRPPAPAVGHAFGLEEVKQRAPNPVSPNMIRRAYEFGKQKARDQGRVLKIAGIALGVGLALALTVMGFIWLLNQLGSSGGGGGGGDGGGGSVLSILSLLFAAPNRDMIRRRVTKFVETSEGG